MASANPTPRAPRRALSATDEFWFSPAAADVRPPSCDDDGERDGSTTTANPPASVAMPPAHRQLLADEEKPWSEPLKGHDHTQDVSDDGPSWPALSAPTLSGGSAWLPFAFAR